jgi:hypothetical protein
MERKNKMKIKFLALCFLLLFVTTVWALPIENGLVMHLDASSESGVGDGGSVATWHDQSTAGNDATQPTTENQPVFVASDPNFSGFPVINFDGTNDWMSLPSTTMTVGDCTVFAAARFGRLSGQTLGNRQYIMAGQDGGGDDRIRFQMDHNNDDNPFYTYRIGNTGWADMRVTPVDTETHIFAITSTSEGYLDINNVASATNGSTENPTAFGLGSYNRGEKDFLEGDIAEFIVYNRVLSSSEVDEMNNYLYDKYIKGIVGSNKAWNPDPSSGSKDVGIAAGANINVQLKWKTGLDSSDPCNPEAGIPDPNITSHMLYYGPDDPNLEKGTVVSVNIPSGYPTVDPNAEYLVTGLDYNQLYHWRVDEVRGGDPCVSTGNVWNFTTIGEAPVIISQPLDVLSEDPCVVQFVVGVQSVTTPSYTWKQSDDAQAGGDLTVGTDSNVLTVIANDSNEAFYYCVVNNDSGIPATSDIVGLWLKKEAARYKLNNDLTDASGNGYPGEWDAAGDPCVAHQTFDVNAIEGSHSVLLQEDVNAFISVPGSEDYFNHYVVGLTASAWVKVASGAVDNDAIVSKHALSTTGSDNFNDGTWEGWTLQLSNGNPRFEIRHADVFVSTDAVDDDQWHMITAVYDVDNSRARLYIDGLLIGEDADIDTAGAEKTSLDRLAIGSVDANDGGYHVNPFDGQIDDVRIFTYPKTSIEVAAMYIEHVDASICIDKINPEYDFNDDCQTNFIDLAMFAATWLDCNLYPASKCSE